MSFPVVCPSCGAPSGPSTGVCPFCKSVVAAGKRKDEPASLTELRKVYRDGNLPRALSLCASVAAEKPKMLENVEFLLIHAKILLETEGPTSMIKSLLGKAYALEPANREVVEYLEITEAKSLLTRQAADPGEQKLADVIRRSPGNAHALFFLGAHLFWLSGDTASSLRYLERCVRAHPKFLRAWGCLGAVYEKLGQAALAAKAYRQCLALETEPTMKTFFKRKVETAAG
jgi:predicted Zn-dependent protease